MSQFNLGNVRTLGLGVAPIGATPWQTFLNQLTPANMAAAAQVSLQEGRELLAKMGATGRTNAVGGPLVLAAAPVDPELLARLESYGGAALLALLIGVAAGRLGAGALSGGVKPSKADEKLMTLLSAKEIHHLVRELSCHPTFSRAMGLFTHYLEKGMEFRAQARRAKDLAPFSRTINWVAPPMVAFALEIVAAVFFNHTPTNEEVAGFLAITGFTADRFGASVPKNDPWYIRIARDFTSALAVYAFGGESGGQIAGAMFGAVAVGYAGDAVLSKVASSRKPELLHDDYLKAERVGKGLVDLSGLLFGFFNGSGPFVETEKGTTFKGKPLAFPKEVLNLVGTGTVIPNGDGERTKRTEQETEGLMEALVAFIDRDQTVKDRFQALEVALTVWSEGMERDLNDVGRLRDESIDRTTAAKVAKSEAKKAAAKAK